jgi:glycosyltransferase involved in cell wall biosynthesis
VKIGLITRFFDLRNGGIGRFSQEMWEGLRKRGYDITPVSTNREGDFGYLMYTAIDLMRALPKSCDIYHCLTPLEAIYAPKKLSIVTFHDLIPWLHLSRTETHYAQGTLRQMKRLGSKYYFKIATKIATRCRLIACDSQQTRSELIEHLGADEAKVSVVRLGIARGLEARPKKDGVFRVGTLSWLDPRKRIDILIQAFLAANIDGELIIGGTGVDYPRLAQMAGQDGRIKFAGFVPEEKLVDFYNSLDLFVFPTKVEGYGLPIIEAFACKKPAVVLHDAIIPDEVKSHCIVVDNLTDFLRGPESVPDVEANYRFARMHDWDSCVEQYIQLYRRVS